MLTKNAVGNLINKYKAVLQNCRLLNILGTLTMASTVLTANNVYAASYAEIVNFIKSYDVDTYSIDTTPTSDVSFTTTINGTVTTFYVLKNGASTTTTTHDDTVYNQSHIGEAATKSVTINSTNYTVGGGLYIDSDISTNITVDFIANTATNAGGAIYNDHTGIIDTISGSAFVGNSATSTGNGGAIYNSGTICNITGSTFVGNTATNGGAMYNDHNGITGATIKPGYYGAKYVADATQAAFEAGENDTSTKWHADAANDAIKNNTSSSKEDKDAAQAVFDAVSNANGGYGSPTQMNDGAQDEFKNYYDITDGIINSVFIGNTAIQDGGAIYNSGTTGDITNSTFISNTAGTRGGAIYTTNDLTFNANNDDIVFIDNKAASDFNAIYVDAADKKLTFNLEVSGNVHMNDGINGGNLYDVEIMGTNSTGAFYLNDEMKNVNSLIVTGATLELGSYAHNNDTVTKGQIAAHSAITFGVNSKLIVDGSIFTNGATEVINGSGVATINVDATSTLELKNVSTGEYTILADFDEAQTNTVWADANVSAANAALTIQDAMDTDGNYIISVTTNDNAFAGVSTGTKKSLTAIIGDKNNPAFTQVDAIMSDKSVPDANKAVAAEHMLSGRSADVSTVAYTTTAGAHDVITSQLSSHLSGTITVTVNDVSDTSTMTASADVAPDIVSDMPSTSYIKQNDYGLHVWAMPFYQNHNSNGLESNSTSSDAENNFGGLVLGADKTFGDWRLGLAINAGSGGIKAKSDYATTDTDYDFYGFNLYAGRNFGDFGFTAQLGYSHGSYDSYIDQSTAGADHELDMTSHTYAVALHGTYAMDTDFADLTPYLGLSFMHFVLEDCDLMSVSGTKTASISTEDQDIWTMPFGVTISKNFAHNDWTLTPAIELGGILAMGDLDSHASSRAGSAPAMDVVADVVDDWTFDTGLKLTAVKGVATINLGYDLQVSEHMTNHGVFARVGYSF